MGRFGTEIAWTVDPNNLGSSLAHHDGRLLISGLSGLGPRLGPEQPRMIHCFD